MCGFGGILHWDREPVVREDLSRMAGSLRHRGPNELCAVAPEEGVGLVHARLSVIDVSDAARQPMSNAGGNLWLLYNGEIYNFRELRKELQALGHRFRSQSDTEVVLRAYEEWGSEAIPRLDGMFALSVWDARRRRLLFARDRTGKKPLYYWTDGRCVAFGSEIKSLLVHPHVPREVREEALPFLLAFGYPPPGETCYAQIRQVLPASIICFEEGLCDPQSHPYWDLPIGPSKPISSEEARQQLRGILTEAVRRRLVSDVPLGAFLSGGVDSSIVVGLMAETLGHPVKTFSIGFEGDARFDETQYAQLVAEKFKTVHTVFRVTPQSADLLERLVWHYDQPFGDSSAIPTYLLSGLTREHVTVALTGDGGDEAFAGYSRFVAALWAQMLPRRLEAVADQFLSWWPVESERSFTGRWKRFFGVARLPLPERYWRWIGYFRGASQWPMVHSNGFRPLGTLHPSLNEHWQRSQGGSLLSSLLYLNLKEYLPDDLLVKMDRCSMAHGLETRSPFLDTRLLEFAAALPDSFKIRRGRMKVLLKEAFRDLLPEAIRKRGKMGFGVPLGTWFRGAWKTFLEDRLLAPTALLYRYLDADCVKALVRRHLEGREDAGHRLWLLLTLEVWLQQLVIPYPLGDRGEVLWLKQEETGIPHV